MSNDPRDYADEVKDCPHCPNSGAVIEGTSRAGYYVTCRSCLSQGPRSATKDGALQGWNSRWDGGNKKSAAPLAEARSLRGQALSEDSTGALSPIGPADKVAP